jgi:hypothetical protein
VIATYVEPAVTVLSWNDAATALRWALEGPNSTPSPEVLSLCLAKSALETGRWTKIWNYNFGNVKAGGSYVGMFTCIRLNEVIGGKVKWFDPDSEGFAVPPGHPQTRMRAFANAWDGAQAYIEVLQERFRPAYDSMLTGNAEKYVRTLKRLNYFTADEEPYLRGVQSLQREFMAKLQGLPHEDVRLDDLSADVERLQKLWFFDQTGESDAPAST